MNIRSSYQMNSYMSVCSVPEVLKLLLQWSMPLMQSGYRTHVHVRWWKLPESCELNYQVDSYFSLHMFGKPMMKNEYMKLHKQTPLFTRRWQAHYVT